MFNPAEASKRIKEEFASYIKTTFAFSDSSLREQFSHEIDATISKGPYLEINSVFKTGKSISELIEEGVLSPLFADLEKTKAKPVLPLNRKLYLHQEQSIRTIVNGSNAVISTGTGSGKTNCFLIPVINELLREKENKTLGPGIRAIFIYPMNALANDQIKNIRRLLMDYEDITFGVYNGSTKNDEDDAIALYESMFAGEKIEKLRHPLKNELISREKMKETPPNILFTNYAMLEHLLFRPNDDVLFSNSDFRFIVLDEAHVYSGATGIETAILLRRLEARVVSKSKIQYILTSATLGSGTDYDDDIVRFAENLCGEKFDKGNIIRSTRLTYAEGTGLKDYDFNLIKELSDQENLVSAVLDKFQIPYQKGKEEAELLYDFISSSKQYHRLRQYYLRLKKNVCSIKTIQKENVLGTGDLDSVIAFISLCTRARKNGQKLIDARYHYFLRSLEGAFITLQEQKKLTLTRQNFIDGYKVFEIAICPDCGKYALVGKIEDGKLVQCKRYDPQLEYFVFLDDYDSEAEEDDEKIEDVYYLCPQCGAIVEEDDIKNKPCDCDSHKYVRVGKIKRKAIGSEGLVRCINCHNGYYSRLYLGNDAATSVIATALYEELPELTYEEDVVAPVKKSIFGNLLLHAKKKEITKGRQFLVFSDGRQEAAKFACYLSKSYQEFLRRRGICHIIEQNKNSIIQENYTVEDFVRKLTSYFSNKRTFASSNNDFSNLTTISEKNAWVAMMNEMMRFSSSTSLTALGVLQFSYLGNDKLVDPLVDQYNISKEDSRMFLDLLAFEVAKTGAIIPNDDTILTDDDREYLFYSPSQHFLTRFAETEKRKATVSNWLPKARNTRNGAYYFSNKLNYVKEFLKISDVEAYEFLDNYFSYLTDPESGNDYPMISPNKDGNYVLPVRYFKVLIYSDPRAKWYRCNRCFRISPFHCFGHCVMGRCHSTVKEILPKEIWKDNHFVNLYFAERMTPLFIKEHTAQLSKKESAEYQEQFIKKEINALSCSTTFEMGVDVGDLETVFLRDVPPLPSNYAQRAGRAGRSVDSAAYCVTFAKLSSHDLSYFQEPEKMIDGIILPPLFKVDNEKIVKRHVYDVALSMFLKMKPEFYDKNNADSFINEKGYQEFIDWLETKPDRLKDLLKKSIPDVNNLHQRLGINDFSWLNDFCGENGIFTSLIREYEYNVSEFEKLIKSLKKTSLHDASLTETKLNIYKNNKLIDFLARGNILPRYGFPVDTVELEQNVTASNIEKLTLTRDLSIAIAEYAPSSEVIADGKMYTSRYIKKTILGNSKEWRTAYIGRCPNDECQTMNYSVVPIGEEGIPCSSCGEIMHPIDFKESIEPVSGFATDTIAKDVPMKRQEKSYRSEDYYIGNTESKMIDKFNFLINGIKVEIESTTNDSLMVKSSKDFYVCSKCGYAIASDETLPNDSEANKLIRMRAHKITTKNEHISAFGNYKCPNTELQRYSLHHVFNTDVAKISFGCDTSDYDTMISVLYALLYATCDILNIERSDLKGCLARKISNHNVQHSIIIYDAVPGGAGHSRRLVTEDGMLFIKIVKAALKKMELCHCDPSCYNCLRSYENQQIHDKLNRKLAIKFLTKLDGDIELEK